MLELFHRPWLFPLSLGEGKGEGDWIVADQLTFEGHWPNPLSGNGGSVMRSVRARLFVGRASLGAAGFVLSRRFLLSPRAPLPHSPTKCTATSRT